MTICAAQDCGRAMAAKGFCTMHYNRWRRHGDPSVVQRMVPRGSSVTERLDIVLDRSGGDDACHSFTRPLGKSGYGYLQIDGVTKGVHVWAFLAAGGVLTSERPFVLHSCDNPPCANPRHLRAGTPQENADDKVARGRQYRPPRKQLAQVSS